jgi:hypothetical protein
MTIRRKVIPLHLVAVPHLSLVVGAVAVVIAMPRLDHDHVAIPVMPVHVAIPARVAVSIADPDTVNTDLDALREDRRLVGNDRRAGNRRDGQTRDSK